MSETIGAAKKSSWRGRASQVARAVVFVYLGVVLAMFFLQNYFIFPGASSQGTAEGRVSPGKNYELLHLKAADGTDIGAIFGKATDEHFSQRADYAQRPTILFFYGNGQCIAYSMDFFAEFRAHGFNVIIPDYEGYGMSGGKPSEAGCYAAADAAYDYLLARGDVRTDRFVAFGWSLGGAAAIDLAHRRPVAGLITFSAFTSLQDVARVHYPWLPTSLLLRYKFDNLQKIQDIACPILIVHGAMDSIVPPEMSDRLAAVAGKSASPPANVTHVLVPGAGHNDLFDVGGDALMQQLAEFGKRVQ
jgi:uncharacterized protein